MELKGGLYKNAMKKALKQQNKIAPAGGPTFQVEGGAAGVPKPPVRLPPLAIPSESSSADADAALTTLNQATITSATFTLTPSGTGVATFEFRSLQPLARASQPAAVAFTPSKGARAAHGNASLSGGGEKPKKRGESASKAHKQLKSIMSGLGVTFRSLGAIIAITLLGNVVFSSLEVDSENESRANHTAYMTRLQSKYNMTEGDFAELVDYIGTPLEFDPDSTDRNWGVYNSNSALFVFTIVSTIGYGNFVRLPLTIPLHTHLSHSLPPRGGVVADTRRVLQAPVTDGGKIFLMVYAMIGIPVVGVCVGVLASQLLGVLEYWAVMHMDVVEDAFVRKMMNFVSKTRNFALKSRNCVLKMRNFVSQTRNFAFKMMNFAETLR